MAKGIWNLICLIALQSCTFQTRASVADGAGSTTTAQYDGASNAKTLPRSHYGPGRFASNFKKSRNFVPLAKLTASGVSKVNKTWISANLQRAWNDAKTAVPVGTVAVKEFETVEGMRLGVMIKMGSGYDEAGGNWYYEVRDANGELLLSPPSGKIEACRVCHERRGKLDQLPSLHLAH